jgi:hypothetical protein
MLAAYVWGPVNYARAELAGKPVPADVMTYVRRALAAREVYRNKADRPRGSLMAAINTAFEALASLNPEWPPVTTTIASWRPFYAAHRDTSDAAAVLSPALQAQWRNYAAAYDRAPITDESTPRPGLLEPDVWLRVAKAVDRIKTKAGEAALGVGSGLFVVALFLAYVSSRRR